MARKLTEEEALNNLKEMQSDYLFIFEGGYINALTQNLHKCQDIGIHFNSYRRTRFYK